MSRLDKQDIDRLVDMHADLEYKIADLKEVAVLREVSLTVTKLEEASFWLSKAIVEANRLRDLRRNNR